MRILEIVSTVIYLVYRSIVFGGFLHKNEQMFYILSEISVFNYCSIIDTTVTDWNQIIITTDIYIRNLKMEAFV